MILRNDFANGLLEREGLGQLSGPPQHKIVVYETVFPRLLLTVML